MTEFKNTFFTFFFDIGEKNRKEIKNNDRYCLKRYLESIDKISKNCKNLFIWCEESVYEKIKYLENDQIIIEKKEFKDLRMYKNKDLIIESLKNMNNIRNKKNYSCLFKKHCNFEAILNYLIVVNSKIEMVKYVKDKNPFDSNIFTWIDFGIYQHRLVKDRILKPIYTQTMRLCLNYKNIDYELKNMKTLNKLCIYTGDIDIEFAFTSFVINVNYIDYIYKEYYSYIDDLFSQNLTGLEQGVFTLFCKEKNLYDKIDIIPGGYSSLNKLFV